MERIQGKLEGRIVGSREDLRERGVTQAAPDCDHWSKLEGYGFEEAGRGLCEW